ncbi:MAG: CRTAC1 family protein [Deltaproteobacteria bacterium]|nr:CRTAC1 family protein [Deltaproteobacteria bacterium]
MDARAPGLRPGIRHWGWLFLRLLAVLLLAGCERRDDSPRPDEQKWVQGVRFTEVTETAGIARATQTYDAAIADFDDDSWPDLYVGNHAGGATLLRNQGDGTFRDVLPQSGITASGDQHGTGWADANGDGHLDLYVTLGAGRGLATKSNRLYRGDGRGRFVDVAADSGASDPSGRSRAMAWLDVDRDGDLDLAVINFASPNRLFLNRGDGTFEDASEAWGIASLSGTRITWGDYDGDGFPDLLLSGTPKGLRLLRNDRGSRFVDATRDAGLEPMHDPIQGMAFGDYDNDGDLDLAASFGADFNEGIVDDQHGTLRFAFFAHDDPAGFDFTAAADATGVDLDLYENGSPVAADRIRCGADGVSSWRFTCPATATVASEASDVPLFLVWRDAGERRDCDDCPARQLWHLRWQGRGDHHLSGIVRGGRDPAPVDLRTDVQRGAALWRNDGGVFVRDLDSQHGLPEASGVNGQAVQWADVDSDGWLDLYLVNSGLDGESSSSLLLLNDRGRRFVAVPAVSGATPDSGAGRAVGAHFFDYDRDGRLDLFLTNGWGAPPFDQGPYRLLRNVGATGHWLALTLRGRSSNRDGLGATVVVEACGERRTRYQNGGTSYFSQSITPLHFGLGPCEVIDSIEIRWPSGTKQNLHDIPADQHVQVEESP